jgi:acid stress chaperone HdeB
MEVAVKFRLLLTSALFLFAQSPTTQAQETLDLAKITCDQFMGEKLATPSRDIVMWLSGYYHGKHNNTIVQPQTLKQNEEKVYSYCSRHSDTTVMDAVESMLASDK